MKKRLKYLLFSVVCCISLVNCATPLPALFTFSGQHLYDRSAGTTLGPGRVMTKGESCSFSFLIANYFFYGPDRSIEKAVRDARIMKIASIDYETMYILGPLFYRDCVIVWGEEEKVSSGNTVTGFGDSVVLKNGKKYENVKVAVTGDSVVVTTTDGKTIVHKKGEVKSVDKKE